MTTVAVNSTAFPILKAPADIERCAAVINYSGPAANLALVIRVFDMGNLATPIASQVGPGIAVAGSGLVSLQASATPLVASIHRGSILAAMIEVVDLSQNSLIIWQSTMFTGAWQIT